MTEREKKRKRVVGFQSSRWMKDSRAPAANLTFIFCLGSLRVRTAKSSQLIRGSNLTSPQKSAHVLSRFAPYIFLCPFHQECASNYAFSLPLFPVFVCVCVWCQTTQRDPGKKNLPEGGKKKAWNRLSGRSVDWRLVCMCFSLSVCVCLS